MNFYVNRFEMWDSYDFDLGHFTSFNKGTFELLTYHLICKILLKNLDKWGVDNRKGHNYQNHDFELTQLLYAIHHGD